MRNNGRIPESSALGTLAGAEPVRDRVLLYGEAWEAYSMRRLKENPAIAGHVVKGLFHRELRPRARPL